MNNLKTLTAAIAFATFGIGAPAVMAQAGGAPAQQQYEQGQPAAAPISDENLEKFAELLFDFAAASPDREATVRLACGITAIYRYLDEKKAPVSLNRYYILKELENITAR